MFAEVVARKRYRVAGSQTSAMCGLGSFAEIVVVQEQQLVRVESDLPDAQLAIIGCAVVTGAGAVFNRARVAPGSSVAVLGCGGVGIAAVQAAHIAGATEIVAVEPDPAKREAALALGATRAVDPASAPVAEQILDLTHGQGVSSAIECVGGSAAVIQAMAATARGGICVQLGTPTPGDRIEIPPGHPERMFTTSVYGSGDVRRDIPRLVALANTRRLDLAAMVSMSLPQEATAVNRALYAPAPGVIRSAIAYANP
jgi:S-(hydroxymethyl)glutathione dehydrogenase/alcohol dehydrogenase